MPKRICTSRAEWRLQTGKPAEALSANYRLECDYGTPVIVCWEKGGTEPIYVCESHAKELGPSRDHGQEARVIGAKSEQGDNPIEREVRSQTPEIAVAKSGGSALPETPRRLEEPKARRTAPEVSTRTRIRDLTFGNSAKAMVDEAIWNLATGDHEAYRTALQQGKAASEAAQAAGGQLAVIHQKICDCTLKLEAVLTESKATINVVETIDKPLEQAMLDIIGNDAMTELEKDAEIQQLGAIQEQVKHGLREVMTPLQTNQIMLAIGERLNWGGSSEVSKTCKPVYRTVYINLKTAMFGAVPEAKNLVDRLTNLYAAKSEVNPELRSTKELTSTR